MLQAQQQAGSQPSLHDRVWEEALQPQVRSKVAVLVSITSPGANQGSAGLTLLCSQGCEVWHAAMHE